MGLKRSGMRKTVEGNTQFTLTPDDNESILIRSVRINTPSSSYATFKIAQTTVGYWRVGGDLGNLLHFPLQDDQKMNLMEKLIMEGVMRPYPVGEGETFQISGVHQATSTVEVIYDIHDAGDVQKTQPNASAFTELDYISFGRYNTTLPDGEALLDTLVNSSEFSSWPFSGNVPQNHKFVLHGYCFTDMSKATSGVTNKQMTKYVRLAKDQTSMFDDSLSGIPHIGGTYAADAEAIGTGLADAGAYTDVDRRPFLKFKEPVEFNAGSDLNVYVTTSLDAGAINLAATDVEIGLILTMQKQR